MSTPPIPPPLPTDEFPALRGVCVYASDPSMALQVSSAEVACATILLRSVDLKGPGPVGDYVEVIDYDPLERCYYTPVDLDQPVLLMNGGLAPNESDPRFHQQMVYAVAMHTVQAFEAALGRRVLWAPMPFDARKLSSKRLADDADFVKTLRIYPHALREENAYYDPERKALLLGYYPAENTAVGSTAPNALVFSCLSFDVVAHETTHAILDGLHHRYMESTNPDVLAFHEAFSDIVALFSRFGLSDFLRFAIGRARGDLSTDNLLAQLAVQFGQGLGKYGGLRNAIGVFDEKGDFKRVTQRDRSLQSETEPHARGSILVSAVFDAFLGIYQRRTADLLRIATDGTGILRPGAIAPDLVNRLADEAAKIARQILTMCIRALDYVPSVDITFGEYLRAILTADYDTVKNDVHLYRISFIESFRKWGIYPESVSTLGEASLRWSTLRSEIDDKKLPKSLNEWQVEFGKDMLECMSKYKRSFTREEVHKWSKKTARIIHRLLLKVLKDPALQDVAHQVFGIDPTITRDPTNGKGPVFEVHSARPLIRFPVDEIEHPSVELIIILTQKVRVNPDTGKNAAPKEPGFIFRGGSTIVYDVDKTEFRYVVRKNINSPTRRQRQKDYQDIGGTALYFDSSTQPFRMLHDMGGM